MSVTQTSLLAYRSLDRIGHKQKLCYKQIERAGVLCNQEIAFLLQWPINTITPRIKELRELGLVEEAYKDIYPLTNRTVTYWKIRE